MSEEDQEKTEEPSQKKLEEARKRGQIYQSREVNSFMLVFTLAMIIGWMADDIMIQSQMLLAVFIIQPDLIPAGDNGLAQAMKETVFKSAAILMGPLLAFVVAALTASMVQKPLILSAGPITPKWEKVSPVKGLSRLFSSRSVMEFLKGIVKITIVGIIAWKSVAPYQGDIARLPDTDMAAMLHLMEKMAGDMLTGILIAMFFIALFDYMYQRYEYMKNLRMSKQEQKDEYKQQEGDPHIKQRIRALRMERARKRMMAEVPTSDVIITNPTHYAVALRYDNMKMAAPMVVAKGQDKVALKIREVAKEHDVPIVENPPLARALFTVDIDKEVPLEHYKAVAEIISYVYKLKNKVLKPRV